MEHPFDGLAMSLAGELSRRECLLRLVRGLAGLLLASLGLRAVAEPKVAEAAATKDLTVWGVSRRALPPGAIGITLGGSVVGNRPNSAGAITPFVIPDFVNTPDRILDLGLLPGTQNTIASAAVDVPPDPRTFCTQQARRNGMDVRPACVPLEVRLVGTGNTGGQVGISRAFGVDVRLDTGEVTQRLDLGTGFASSGALGVDLFGTVYGWGALLNASSQPVVWSAGQPPYVVGGTLAGVATTGNASGTIGGDGFCQGFDQTCAWVNLRGEAQSTFAAYPQGGPNTLGGMLNHLEIMAFTADDAQGNFHAFLWDLRQGWTKPVTPPGAPESVAVGIDNHACVYHAASFKAGAAITRADFSDPDNIRQTPTGLFTCQDSELFSPVPEVNADGTIVLCLKADSGQLIRILQTPTARGDISETEAAGFVKVLRGLIATVNQEREADPESVAGRLLFLIWLYLTHAVRHLTPPAGQGFVFDTDAGQTEHLLLTIRYLAQHPKIRLIIQQAVIAAVDTVGKSILQSFPVIGPPGPFCEGEYCGSPCQKNEECYKDDLGDCCRGSCCPKDQKCCGGVCVTCPPTTIDGQSLRCCGKVCVVCPGPFGSADPNLMCCPIPGENAQGCYDLNIAPHNCGVCGIVCANVGELCCGGKCCAVQGGVRSCCLDDTGKKAVRVCTDLTQEGLDRKNCGSCGDDCGAGANKEKRLCCGGSCFDEQKDNDHCGKCRNHCTTPQICCNGACKNKLTDDQNCGDGCIDCTSMTMNKKCCRGACKDNMNDDQYCGPNCTDCTVQKKRCKGGRCVV